MYLKLINENSNRLFTITKGLNDYYILDSETIKIEESVNLRKIAEEAMEILSKEIRDKNIEVKIGNSLGYLENSLPIYNNQKIYIGEELTFKHYNVSKGYFEVKIDNKLYDTKVFVK